ncbi:MAG: LLM class flavin-dependent oxidoreductase [Chloroflexi bacterium]|nr:LLM class flavin-dependent oxidoreductase [Chloroflexota bacterium]
MHVGFGPLFQNPENELSDLEVYQQELRLADLAEPLGFDSVWSVEHHFTDYTMCPDVIQFLSYMAGRTTRLKLGSMVVVLPWHDPVRVAEQVAMLDNMSGGRMILGVGRGLGRVEFGGFRVDMNESRARFDEYAALILTGLERGYLEFEGEFIRQPRRDIRPAPFRSFKGRTFAAAVSPDSIPVAARIGAGLLVIPQKPWPDVAKDFELYRQVWSETWATPPAKPLMGGFCFVDRDPARAKDMALRYIGRYYHTVMKHYEMTAGHFAETKGYEYYSKLHKYIDRHGKDGAAEAFADLMPWGTPDQVLEKLHTIRGVIDMKGMMCHFAYAGMPYTEAERNMRLWAEAVLPELKRWDTEPFAEPAPLSLGREPVLAT